MKEIFFLSKFLIFETKLYDNLNGNKIKYGKIFLLVVWNNYRNYYKVQDVENIKLTVITMIMVYLCKRKLYSRGSENTLLLYFIKICFSYR